MGEKHSFDVDFAKEHGVVQAVLFANIKYWIEVNRADGRNFHDGHTWTHNSKKAYAEIFPYLSNDQVRRALDAMVSKGILITGNYNTTPYNHTLWYAVADESRYLFARESDAQSIGGQRPIDLAPVPNRIGNDAQSLERTDSKPDNNPDIRLLSTPSDGCPPEKTVFNAWNRHAHRKVTKNGSKISWHQHRKLSEEIILGVKLVTKHHAVDEIVAAIDNYAKVLLGSEYYWSYVWTLPDFLTRKQGKEKTCPPQIIRFLPDNFHDEQWRIRRPGDGDEESCDLAAPFLLTEEQLNRAAYEECERKGFPWTQQEADAAKAARERGEKWVRTGAMPRYEDGQTDDNL